MKNSLFTKRRDSKVSSDASLWFRFFGEDHFSLFGLMTFMICILLIGKVSKGVSLMIIQICLVLNGAIHFEVIDFKEKS